MNRVLFTFLLNDYILGFYKRVIYLHETLVGETAKLGVIIINAVNRR